MTQQQYEDLCQIILDGKRPTDEELKEMNFSPVDGIFDKDVDWDIGLFKFEEYKNKCRKEQK